MSALADIEDLIIICPTQSVMKLVEAFVGTNTEIQPNKNLNLPHEPPCDLVERSLDQYSPLSPKYSSHFSPEVHKEYLMSLEMSPNRVGHTPTALSSCEVTPERPVEVKTKRKCHQTRVFPAVGPSRGQRRRHSFDSEESLEEISELDMKESIIMSHEGAENKENLEGLEDMVNRLTLAKAGDGDKRQGQRDGRKRPKASQRVTEWLGKRSRMRPNSGNVVAYSEDCAHEVRTVLLSESLREAAKSRSTGEPLDHELHMGGTSASENRGSVLVVTSRAAIALWGEVVDNVGSHLRFVDYSLSAKKRQCLRISEHCADVVLTTWDVLKCKEVVISGKQCSYCHALRWASIVVDYHSARVPSVANQAGRAIQALKSVTSSSSSSSHQARVRTSLVQFDAGGGSVDRFLPKIASMAGLGSPLSEAFFDAR
jgi:hypothetical protein